MNLARKFKTHSGITRLRKWSIIIKRPISGQILANKILCINSLALPKLFHTHLPTWVHSHWLPKAGVIVALIVQFMDLCCVAQLLIHIGRSIYLVLIHHLAADNNSFVTRAKRLWEVGARQPHTGTRELCPGLRSSGDPCRGVLGRNMRRHPPGISVRAPPSSALGCGKSETWPLARLVAGYKQKDADRTPQLRALWLCRYMP